MEAYWWVTGSLIPFLSYFLYFVLRRVVRTITVNEINAVLEKDAAEKRRRKADQRRKDHVRHYAEFFTFIPVVFALFLTYSGADALTRHVNNPDSARFDALVMAPLLCFLVFVGIHLFAVYMSKYGDLLALVRKREPRGRLLFYIGAPVLEWCLLAVMVYVLRF